ncbi:hypothetical protein EV426DRAFT_264342 [Tirmania nivea]|nr:hypothetical protein EV426DRAFT_264342 [Tirmania nivea]
MPVLYRLDRRLFTSVLFISRGVLPTTPQRPQFLGCSTPRPNPARAVSTAHNTACMPPPRVPPNTPASPPPPRLSSSLLLLDHQSRVLVVQRSHTKSMSFSSAVVFPGGNLDPTHDSFLLPPASPPLPTALPPGQLDPSPELVTALKVCAIRETFEETGVLLADPRSPDQPPPAESDLSRARSLLLDTESTTTTTFSFSQVLASLNLTLLLASLHPFTTWITPPHLPKRYHTAMFLCFLPPTALPALPPSPSSEILQCRWLHPRDLLREYHAPAPASATKPLLFPPQLYLLTTLASFLRAPAPAPALLSLSQSAFGKYVIQPYTKRADGMDKTKALLGIDKPRGDKAVWLRARFGKDGPAEVEVLEREDWRGEGPRARQTGAEAAGAKL